MDVTQALKDAENSLRDFIADVLEAKFGPDWPEKCGLSPDRLAHWKERKVAEGKRQQTGAVDERLIYYADFYDLAPLLHKNWSGPFSEAFGDWKTMDVWLSALGDLRDPDAHRRELLPHQKHLALGIAGEIRTRLVRYRSKQETSMDCFPRIDLVRDNYGNVCTDAQGQRNTTTILHPGDILEFVVTASDPMGGELEYSVASDRMQAKIGGLNSWQKSNELILPITDALIGKGVTIVCLVRSLRSYHAEEHWDAGIMFKYDILPRKAAQPSSGH